MTYGKNGVGETFLASHVSALFGAGRLVLKVDSRGACFDEHLHQSHDCGEPTVTSVAVGNDGSEEVGARRVGQALGDTLLPRATVVVLERTEELVDLEG